MIFSIEEIFPEQNPGSTRFNCIECFVAPGLFSEFEAMGKR